MKKLIWIVILVAIGYFAYSYFNKPLSDEEKEVKAVEKQFDSAFSQYYQAGQQMGLGADTTSDIEDAVNLMKKAKKEFLSLKNNLTEDKAIARAEKLEERINSIFEKNRIQ